MTVLKVTSHWKCFLISQFPAHHSETRCLGNQGTQTTNSHFAGEYFIHDYPEYHEAVCQIHFVDQSLFYQSYQLPNLGVIKLSFNSRQKTYLLLLFSSIRPLGVVSVLFEEPIALIWSANLTFFTQEWKCAISTPHVQHRNHLFHCLVLNKPD